MVIHCQVITSQVMAYRPDRDRSVIGQATPPAAMTNHRGRRRVIITTLSVNGRYFGRVTVSVGREPGWAGHEPVRRQAEARHRGKRPRPFRRLPHQKPCVVTRRRPCGGWPVPRRGNSGQATVRRAFNRSDRVFYDAAGKASAAVNSGAIASGGIRRRMQLCARLPDCRSGMTGLGVRGRSRWHRRVPADSGRNPPAPVGWGRWDAPWWAGRGGSGYSRDQPGLLLRAAPHTGICPGQSDTRDVFA